MRAVAREVELYRVVPGTLKPAPGTGYSRSERVTSAPPTKSAQRL